MRITVNFRALIILAAFCALFVAGLSVRLGLLAIIAATLVDWLFVAAPLLAGRGGDRPTR